MKIMDDLKTYFDNLQKVIAQRQQRKKLTVDEVNAALAAGLDDAGFILQDIPPDTIKYGMTFYKKNSSVYITFNVATDNHAIIESTRNLPKCSDIFAYIQTTEFKKNIGINKKIRIYIPIITTYGFTKVDHKQLRGLYIELKPDTNLTKAYLINSRSIFFGGFCPLEVKKDIKHYFPIFKFKNIFTSHQSIIKKDYDSGSYRIVSYGIQLTCDVDPTKLEDEEFSSKRGYSFDSKISPYNNNGKMRTKPSDITREYPKMKEDNHFIVTLILKFFAILFIPMVIPYYILRFIFALIQPIGRVVFTKK